MEKQLKSVWQRKDDLQYKSLSANETCEILVIGGGLAGQLCAYYLSESGHAVTLVEASTIMSGTTSNSTATITSQQGMIYNDIAKKYCLDVAIKYWQAQEEGIQLFKTLIEKHNIDCDFELLDGYFYTQKKDFSEFSEELSVLHNIGAEIEYLTTIESLPLEITAGVRLKNQAQFDVLKFLSHLPRNYTIYENSRVVKVDLANCIAYANDCKITAQKIVIATQYPIINKLGLLAFKMYQSLSYASAYSGAENLHGVYNDDNEDGITLRNYNNMLIVGGADHRTGRKEEDSFVKLDIAAKKMFKDCTKVTSWLAEDVVTYDHIPFVGRYKKHNGNIYVVSGFNKWGMSNSIVSANIINDLINEVDNKYAQIYSPNRAYRMHNMGDCFKNMMVATSHLAKSFLCYPVFRCTKNLVRGQGGVYMIGGKKRAVYKDQLGKLHIFGARCPHMGCQLEFNKEAKSWDCPCHGSRFDIDGKILNEPAVENACKENIDS